MRRDNPCFLSISHSVPDMVLDPIPPKSLAVYLAHGNVAARDQIAQSLRQINHPVRLETGKGQELLHHCQSDPPDLVFIGSDLEDISTVEVMNQLSRMETCSAIALVSQSDYDNASDEINDRVMGILVEPINQAQLRPAIYVAIRRFQQAKRLRTDIAELRDRVYAGEAIFGDNDGETV